MAGFRIVSAQSMGYAPSQGVMPQAPVAQPRPVQAVPGNLQAVIQQLMTRVGTLEENMRRMHGAYQQLAGEHAQLKASTQSAVGTLAQRMGLRVAPAPVQPVQAAAPQVARPNTVAPQAQPAAQPMTAEEVVAQQADQLFYGGDADDVFYSGGEGE